MYKRGFTLVEILFVVIIAAGALALAVPSYKRAQQRAQYMKATGYLSDIGNAIRALQMDYSSYYLSGGSLFQFPVQTNPYQFQNNHTTTAIAAGSSLLDVLHASKNTNARDSTFVNVLYAGEYLKPFNNTTQYNLYGVRAVGKMEICGKLCTNVTENGVEIEVRACMCKNTYNANDCFYGAKYLHDGRVIRITGAACTK